MIKYLQQAAFIIIFLAGMFIIFNCVSMGSNSADEFLRKHGGSMATAQFNVIFQEYISSFRVMGAILAGIGGLGFIRVMKQ